MATSTNYLSNSTFKDFDYDLPTANSANSENANTATHLEWGMKHTRRASVYADSSRSDVEFKSRDVIPIACYDSSGHLHESSSFRECHYGEHLSLRWTRLIFK
jgi:hypothetical protein